MATLKSLLQTAIDTRVGQVLPKEGGIWLSCTASSSGDMWADLDNHINSYTPASDGWIGFYAINVGTWCIRQGSRIVKVDPSQDSYNEGGICTPVRKGVIIDFFFSYRSTNSAPRLVFYPCLQS